MRTHSTVSALRAELEPLRRAGKRIGLVPTMGALHEGHLSLVRAARSRCDIVVVSIFVNPTQFGPHEDFAKYPRQMEQDQALLEREKVDLVFAPQVEEMYPPGAQTFVDAGELGGRLDGRSRPGHFRGVATVVSKLFHIVLPAQAFFGQKDAAQVAVIRRMARDLQFPVEIVVAPTVREPDGLAMSSRNVYLSREERPSALALWRALQSAESAFRNGERDTEKLREAARKTLSSEPRVAVEYVELVDPETLEPEQGLVSEKAVLLAVAARLGSTRLIDNILLDPKKLGPS